ncbi:hypothetical protein GCM10022243_09190 [Saccharothrix violaceirubra]
MVVLAVVGDRAFVEEGAHHVVRLGDVGQRFGAAPVDPVLGEQAEVPAGDHALRASAGQLVQRRGGLGDERGLPQQDRRQARPEADVPRLVRGGEELPMSLCHVSSAAYTAWKPSSSARRIASIESRSGKSGSMA